MLIANIKSNIDLKTKKDLQKQLLELEVANEAENQKRQQAKTKIITEIKPLPEKTTSEQLKDRASSEKKALDNFIDLGFSYTEAGQLTNWLGLSNRLSDFNASFKGIKKDLTERFDKSIITPEFIKDFLDEAFINLDTNLGKRFAKDVGSAPAGTVTSVDSLERIIPSVADIEGLKQVIISRTSDENKQTYRQQLDTAVQLLELYKNILPDESILSTLKTSLGQNDRLKITRKILSLLSRSQFIDKSEIDEIKIELSKENLDNVIFYRIINRLIKQLSFIANENRVNDFSNVYRELISSVEKDAGVVVDISDVESKINALERAKKNEGAITEIADEATRLEKLNPLLQKVRQDFEEVGKYTNYSNKKRTKDIAKLILENYDAYLEETEIANLRKTVDSKKGALTAPELRDILKDIYERALDEDINFQPKSEYVLKGVNKRDKSEGVIPNYTVGVGASNKLLSKLKKHFKGDEALLRKVVKSIEEDTSSESELEEELSRHQKATSGLDKKIEKGIGFKATRISTKKVGKGVKLEKEDNPTYRQFGKYVIHIPYLLNNNVANFKYPSLGGIPSLKPTTISNDYKDLLLETLQTGKLNKKELERLPQAEIKHFERVAIGAGLVEQLGLKVGSADEDKADAKRFELLRGEYLAGNNNNDLLKELRQLITKFVNNGRMHKTEGLNLLLELSTL